MYCTVVDILEKVGCSRYLLYDGTQEIMTYHESLTATVCSTKPCMVVRESIQYSANGPTKSIECSELHNDFEPPMADSALMSVNGITTRKVHCARLHGPSIGMGRPAARAIWIVFSAWPWVFR